eukprot:Phypoly_transcript_10517.p1 GENE.Phypoly_transcript_10517~~Phypoly_transcript_10517.p1  ORF type:complete len:385 (+),score=65.45 Phypoly_transcript_10517:92-1246(+)
MAIRVEVTSVDLEGTNVDVFIGETRIKQLRKTHESISCLSGLLTKWHANKSFPKIPNPNGMWAPTIAATKQGLQEYFDAVIKELPESFAVKSFFRAFDLKGKVIIITGASSGIGKQNAYQLAEMGAHLILGCRSESKTLPIIADIKAKSGNENIEFLALDLISLKSVNDFVEAFKAKNLPLHVLINNAGGVIEGLTDYGVDSTFGSCHVGPVLLTMGLLDILKRTENSRIVFVASKVARSPKGLPFDRIRTKIPVSITNPMESYGYSKLANVIAGKVLAKQLKDQGNNPLVFSLHPGVVATDIWRQMPSAIAFLVKKFMLFEEEGSMMTLYCAIDPGCANFSGNYFDYMYGTTPPDQIPLSEDEALQKLCWEETFKMCGLAQAN